MSLGDQTSNNTASSIKGLQLNDKSGQAIALNYSEIEKVIRRSQTNALARKIISNSIQKVLSTLDEPISRALMYHLCQVSEAAGDDLLLNYKAFENGLRSVLGIGASLLMEKIREDLQKYAAEFVRNQEVVEQSPDYLIEQAAIDEILVVIAEMKQARLR